MKLGVRKVVIGSSETTYGACFAERDKVSTRFARRGLRHRAEGLLWLSKVRVEKTACAAAVHYQADIRALRIGHVIKLHPHSQFKRFAADPPSRKCNVWSYIEARDLGKIMRLCLEKDGLGSQLLNAVDDGMTLNAPTREVLAKLCPTTPNEFDALVKPQGARGPRVQASARLARMRAALGDKELRIATVCNGRRCPCGK